MRVGLVGVGEIGSTRLAEVRAPLVFGGGSGTLDVSFRTLTPVQTRKIRPLPVSLIGRACRARVFDAGCLVAEGVIDPGTAGC